MLAISALLLASIANAVNTPAPPRPAHSPKPTGTGSNNGFGEPFSPAPVQFWDFFSPNVVLDPPGKWETGNLASTAGGPANITISAFEFGINHGGINFTVTGDAAKLRLLANGSTPEKFGGKSKIYKGEGKDIHAEISGLPKGWWEYTLASSADITFRHAVAFGQGPAEAPRQVKLSDEPDWAWTEGEWENERTKTFGASLTIDVPWNTHILEVLADQPPVPFGAFRVTIDPPITGVPAVQDFYPTLRPANIQAAIFHNQVPIYSLLIRDSREHTVTLTYIDNGANPFAADYVRYYP